MHVFEELSLRTESNGTSIWAIHLRNWFWQKCLWTRHRFFGWISGTKLWLWCNPSAMLGLIAMGGMTGTFANSNWATNSISDHLTRHFSNARTRCQSTWCAWKTVIYPSWRHLTFLFKKDSQGSLEYPWPSFQCRTFPVLYYSKRNKRHITRSLGLVRSFI